MVLTTISISSIIYFKGEPSICNSWTELIAPGTEHTVRMKPGSQGSSVLPPTQKHNGHTKSLQQLCLADIPGASRSHLSACPAPYNLHVCDSHPTMGFSDQWLSLIHFFNHSHVNLLDSFSSKGYKGQVQSNNCRCNRKSGRNQGSAPPLYSKFRKGP